MTFSSALLACSSSFAGLDCGFVEAIESSASDDGRRLDVAEIDCGGDGLRRKRRFRWLNNLRSIHDGVLVGAVAVVDVDDDEVIDGVQLFLRSCSSNKRRSLSEIINICGK